MRRKDELLKACLNSTVLLKPLMLFTRSPNATISFIFQITSQLKLQVTTIATDAG